MVINEFLAGVLSTIFVELLVSMVLLVKLAFPYFKEGYEDETTKKTDRI